MKVTMPSTSYVFRKRNVGPNEILVHDKNGNIWLDIKIPKTEKRPNGGSCYWNGTLKLNTAAMGAIMAYLGMRARSEDTFGLDCNKRYIAPDKFVSFFLPFDPRSNLMYMLDERLVSGIDVSDMIKNILVILVESMHTVMNVDPGFLIG